MDPDNKEEQTPMSHQEQLEPNLVCTLEHSEDGQTRDSFQLSALLEANDCITFTTSSLKIYPTEVQTPPVILKIRKSKKSVTVESHQSARKKTLNDKSSTCKKSSQPIESSQILDQASTSRERDFVPSWSLHANKLSQRLWLPLETDCAVLPLNSLKGSFSSMESSSWCSTKAWKPQINRSLQKTSLPSSMFSTVESMVEESTINAVKAKRTNKLRKSGKPVANACRKIRLYPNKECASKLKQWIGCVRHTYNWALECINSKKYMKKISVVDLRKSFVNSESIPCDKKFLLSTPKHIRDGALDDLVTAYMANFTVKKKNPNHKFAIGYRSKKDSQAITIPHDAVRLIVEKDMHTLSMYPTYLVNAIKIRVRKRDKERGKFVSSVECTSKRDKEIGKQVSKLDYTCKLQQDKCGRFYLCVPCCLTKTEDPGSVSACENQASNDDTKSSTVSNEKDNKWVSIDPGLRTFITMFSPTVGEAFKFADGDVSRLVRLCRHLDKLMSKRRSKRVNHAAARLRLRIRHLVDDVHWKAIKFLLEKYNNIILPPFQVSQMVKRANRRIRSKTARSMLTWRHYDFKQRLLQKAKMCEANVYIMGEEYTTKTCTNCMQINERIGGNKVFYCSKCQVKVDRDLGGARNIFLKNVLIATS